MKHVISISLGSSARNHRTETTLLGQPIIIERIGVDGDHKAAHELYLEYDGKVDAFGFGGADLGLTVDGRFFHLHTVRHLVDGVKTPVVDGESVRQAVERHYAQRLLPLLPAHSPKRVMFCVGMARYALVESFHEAGYEAIYGDLAFGLGIPMFVHSIDAVKRLSRTLLPILGRVPLQWLYPMGEDQEKIEPKYEDKYMWAQIIADDFHYIKKHLPDELNGRIIVTNTTTPTDIERLRDRGASYLCTTTPRFEGRTFGTNVMEAAMTAIAGKNRPLTPQEVRHMLTDEQLRPTILDLQRNVEI